MSKRPVVVYLAHPFSGNPKENVQKVTRIAQKIIRFSVEGNSTHFFAPVVPHLPLSIYNEEDNPQIRVVTERVSTTMVGACDEVWVVSNHLSEGMKLEIAAAMNADIPVRKWSEIVKLIPGIEEKT